MSLRRRSCFGTRTFSRRTKLFFWLFITCFVLCGGFTAVFLVAGVRRSDIGKTIDDASQGKDGVSPVLFLSYPRTLHLLVSLNSHARSRAIGRSTRPCIQHRYRCAPGADVMACPWLWELSAARRELWFQQLRKAQYRGRFLR